MMFDLRTLLMAEVLIYLVFGLMQAMMWWLRRSEHAFLFWGIGNLCAAASSLLLGLRGIAPDALSITLANGLVILAIGLMWAGQRRFAAQTVRWNLVVAVPLALMLSFTFHAPIADSIVARTVTVYACLLMFCALGVFDLARAQRREPLGMRRVALGALSVICVMLVAGIWALSGSAEPAADFLAPNLPRFLSLLVLFIGILVWDLALLLMANERLENRLVVIAQIDPLTGILNRAGFRMEAERQLQRCMGNGAPAAVLLLDLDHFKKVNDTHGHDGGDRLLRRFVKSTRQTLCSDDVLARYGGEEFCALMPGATLAAAAETAERIRVQFERVRVDAGKAAFGTTVSIGVAEIALPDETLDAAIARADRALYQAKHQGRNRVATTETPES